MPNYGRIEVICGGMFSGKTEELIRRIKRLLIAKQKIQVFKPIIDDRFSLEHIVSHNTNKISALPVKDSKQISILLNKDTNAVAIDEAQFFDDNITCVCEEIANKGIRVLIAGLDLDYQGKPFGSMPKLLALADEITKLHAICSNCGENACRTALLYNKKTVNLGVSNILIGAENSGYTPLCRKCFSKISKA